MVYYFRKRQHFNYAALRKYFVRFIIVGGILAFIVALISANAAAGSARGVPMDATVAGLMILGTAAAIGLLYLVEAYKKDRKDIMAACIFSLLSVAYW